ncbi:glycosyltransferase [Salana multivorans]
MIRTQPVALAHAPRVSVVIPCYNYARYLEACVRSALDQPGVMVDVTVVDDASQDGSAELADAISREDSRVKVVRHRENLGHLATANEALALAGGEFVVKLDADDLLAPGSLVRSASLLVRRPDVGFVYGEVCDFVDAAPPLAGDRRATSWTVWSGEEWLRAVLRRAHNVIAQPEVMMRRSALRVVGGYDLRLPWAEDYHLWLRLARRGSVGRVNGCVQGYYRVHSESFQRSAKDVRLSDLRARRDATLLFVREEELPDDLREHALAWFARDTRRLLASRRGEEGTPVEVVQEYERIARELERSAGVAPRRGPLVWGGPAGRLARRVFEMSRYRMWKATGLSWW